MLLVLAVLALTTDELLLAILTTVVAAATLVFAVYDMFRIVQKISQVHRDRAVPTSASAGA